MRLRMLLSLLSAFSVGVAYAAFPDVPQNHPYREAIEWLQDEGVVGGNPDDTFRPDTTINRAEFAKIIVHHALGHPAYDFDYQCFGLTEEENMQGKEGTFVFPDVNKDAWFAVPVCAAYTLNLVHGYPDGTFGPARTINFAEAAKIVASLNSSQPLDSSEPWYQSSIDYLEKKKAVPATVRGPDHLLTRGEMAEMLKKVSFASNTGDLPLDEWITYENDEMGFTMSVPAEWQGSHRGQGGAGFSPRQEAEVLGDAPLTAGVEVSDALMGEEYGVKLEKTVSEILQEITESENGNCEEPTPSVVGSLDAMYMRCTAVWDGSLVEHYLIEIDRDLGEWREQGIWDVTVRWGDDPTVRAILLKMLASFQLME